MNFRGVNDFRDKRNQFVNMPYVPMHYSIASYCTDSHKEEMRATFGDEFLSTLPMVPDPLKKNLADTIITAEIPIKRKTKNSLEQSNVGSRITMETPDIKNLERGESYAFSGITNFISGVFNVISGVMFQKRPKSPANQHYDNFDYADDRKRSPGDDWQASKSEDQNINRRAQEQNGEKEMYKTNMNNDYQSAVSTCEDKINQVRKLLDSKPVQKVNKHCRRRPKKQFVEVGSYDEVFEDAFTPDDLVNLASDSKVEHTSPISYQNHDLLETASPKMRTYMTPIECTAIVKTVPEAQKDAEQTVNNNVTVDVVVSEDTDTKCKIVSSCEDKLNKLKALLKNSKKHPIRPTTNIPIEAKRITQDSFSSKVHDRHYKNPHRTTEKRKKMNLNKRIQGDLIFADEIESDYLSSVENSPKMKSEVNSKPESLPDTTHSFDEVTGRFRNVSTTESDDSFQIVFTDESPPIRTQKVSECDSEDSFIVFEDLPEHCYTSTDVFGDDISDSGSESDCESDMSDSGCGISKLSKLKPHLTRTISDLTDDSLYEDVPKCQSEDEVDCAFKSVVELPNQEIKEEKPEAICTQDPVIEKKPVKRVRFSTNPPEVRVMRVWAFAARQARVGRWERDALDRGRFKRRIADVEMAVSWVLKPQHRSRVMFQRFMPWWNAQRRREIAEKKQKAEEAKLLAEEEEKKRLEAQVDEEVIVEGKQNDVNGENVDDNGNTDSKSSVDKFNSLGTNTSVIDDNQDVQSKNGNDNGSCSKVLGTDCIASVDTNVDSILNLQMNGVKNNENDNIKTLNGIHSDSSTGVTKKSNKTTNSSINNKDVSKKCFENELPPAINTELKRLDSAELKIEKICDKLADLKITNGISVNLSGT